MNNWQTKKLGEICEIYQPKTIATKEMKKQGRYPVYGANGIIGFYDKYNHENEEVLVTCRGSTCGTVNLSEPKSWITGNAMVVTPKSEKIKKKFLYYLLMHTNLTSVISGTGQPQITRGELSPLKIPVPPLNVQEKIVKILDTIQEAVEIQGKIIERTKELKKSLMAELFKYGVPSFRKGRKLKKTEIGEIPENWQVVKFREIFSIVAGGDISKINFSPIKTNRFVYPIYSNTIEKKGLYGFSDTYQYESGCITVTARGTIGYAIPRFEKFNAIIRLLVLIPKIELDITFFAEFINEKVKIIFEGTSIPQLTVPKISNIKIPLPPLPVQREIAEILKTVDAKIEIEQKKKETYEELFKTLLNKIMSQKIDVEKMQWG